MSLHAQLSPEARAALERQQRSSKAASLVIAILCTTLLALVMGFVLMPAFEKATPWPQAQYVYPETDEPIDEPRVKVSSTKPASPSAASANLLHVEASGPVAIPVPDNPVDSEAPFGTGDGFGTGFDDGMDDGAGPGGWTRLEPDFRKRCSKEDRIAQLQQGGGTAEIDERVIRALRFLKSTQAADGGWGTSNREAMTGLAVLAYLGHCETALSEEFGDSCLRGITFLTDKGMKGNGRLVENAADKHWPYQQAIATYALAESESIHHALGIDIPGLRGTVQKAGQLIIDSQHKSGGWDYGYDESSSRGGDLSITGWHVQALKACKLTKIDFRNLEGCARKALDYVEARQGSDGGFGYTGTAPVGNAGYCTLTGVGMLSLQMWDKGSRASVRKGAKYALAKMPFEWDSADCDLYGHYYLAQAMFQRGGTDWEKYQPMFRDALMDHQNADGSWPVPGGGNKPAAAGALYAENNANGLHYRTALATLMLEVYYRYLPTGK
ncbi:prenyltransferase/squalene oxidase repeat-containing protein [Haloferula helveola]